MTRNPVLRHHATLLSVGAFLSTSCATTPIATLYVNGFWSSPSNSERENACQPNALSPPIAYYQLMMCLTERHTQT